MSPAPATVLLIDALLALFAMRGVNWTTFPEAPAVLDEQVKKLAVFNKANPMPRVETLLKTLKRHQGPVFATQRVHGLQVELLELLGRWGVPAPLAEAYEWHMNALDGEQ
ncbi:hypothetical protein [Deinococcus sp. 12RED42]|uniref:hypothetical protein n=1 Tax=Deinococcus sp. 12RED42 TaxID=2745872 RepID=UPI001E332C50|nr:hypothetical protein [Deinococcus sp. 12RED42]MCD0164981.1 hypothetical protein [Deinococcus sp. 12RED42]